MERRAGMFTRRRHRPAAEKKMFDNVDVHHSPLLHPAAATTTTNDHQQHDQLHVLAVDDSLVDRKVIERLLKISSCKVTVVDSGWSALQYLGLDGEQNSSASCLDGLKVNLIITDYWMPGMTGYELLKKIKESSTFKEIPVVIMSSENVLPRINRCLEEGAEEFIVKPVKLSDVKRLKDHYYISREEEQEPEPEPVPVAKQEQKPELLLELVTQKEEKATNKRKLQESESEEDDQVKQVTTVVCLSGSSSSSLLTSSSGSSSPLTSDTSSSPSCSPSRKLKTSDGCDY